MPQIFPELETIRNKDPLLAELLGKIINQLGQPLVLSGGTHPEGSVMARPNTIYVQTNFQGGGSQIFVKAGTSPNEASSQGWLHISRIGSQPTRSGGVGPSRTQTYANLSVDPSNSGFLVAGSITPVGVPLLSYVSTSTTATIYWDGTNGSTLLKLYRGNLQQDAFTPGSAQSSNPNFEVTGATAGTYSVYPYYDEYRMFVDFVGSRKEVSGGSGTPPILFPSPNTVIAAGQMQNAQDHLPLTVGALTVVVGTGASGTGGGSTSSRCIHPWMTVETSSHHFRLLNECSVGDELQGPQGPTRIVTLAEVEIEPYVEIRWSNRAIQVLTESHGNLVMGDSSRLIASRNLTLGHKLRSRYDGIVEIVGLELLKKPEIRPWFIRTDPYEVFWSGFHGRPEIPTHNTLFKV